MKPRLHAVFTLPHLSDETVIQIHDFMHYLLDLFESCYGEQIDRFYKSLYEQWPDCDSDSDSDSGDSIF